MKEIKKNVLSLFALVIFALLAVSSKVNQLHYGAFNYDVSVEEKSERNYLEKNDGTKVYWSSLKSKSGLLVKDQFTIDNQKFPYSEIKGYRDGNFYYKRFKNDYLKRIVHGKINVYVQFVEASTTSTSINGSIRTSYYTRTNHYAQKGDDGDLIGFYDQASIKQLISDCPLSVEMIDISKSKVKKAIKKDRAYLNSIFEVYNNDCKPIK
jgi:uncharacterized protein YxeA